MKKKKLKKQLKNLRSRVARLESNSTCRVFSYGYGEMTLQQYAKATEKEISRLKSACKLNKDD